MFQPGTTGKGERFTIKCNQCPYSLAGIRLSQSNRWAVAVRKKYGNKEFTSFHSEKCTLCGETSDPSIMYDAVPHGMEQYLSAEDLFILRRLGVAFKEANIGKTVLRRSRDPPKRWNVDEFIRYVEQYCNILPADATLHELSSNLDLVPVSPVEPPDNTVSSTDELKVGPPPNLRHTISNKTLISALTQVLHSLTEPKFAEGTHSSIDWTGDTVKLANECILSMEMLPINYGELHNTLSEQLALIKALKCYTVLQEKHICSILTDLLNDIKGQMSNSNLLLPESRSSGKCELCQLLVNNCNFAVMTCQHQYCIECAVSLDHCIHCDNIFIDPRKAPFNLETLQEMVARSNERKMWALNQIAKCYEDGAVVPSNPTAAVGYYTVAASAGDPFAQYRLAQLYEKGNYVQQSMDEARRLYTEAAKSGHRGAKSHAYELSDPRLAVSNLFSHINSEESNYACDRSFCETKFYTLCSQLGSADASRQMGYEYLSGKGSKAVSLPNALKYLQLAEQQGDASATLQQVIWYVLGCSEYYETSPNRSLRRALNHFVLGARHGDRRCMEMYINIALPILAPARYLETLAAISKEDLVRMVERFEQEFIDKTHIIEDYNIHHSSPPLPASLYAFPPETEEDRLARIKFIYAKNYLVTAASKRIKLSH